MSNMTIHSSRTQTTAMPLIARLALGVSLMVLALASFSVHATSGRGTEINATCTAFNGTAPYTANNNSCALCHETNRATRRDPEWTWTQAGPGSAGQQNFCMVQGIITAPATNPTSVAQGGRVALSARGFSPRGGTLTHRWNFNDGTASLTGATATATLNNAGTVLMTLVSTDSTNATDPTPDQRTFNVAASGVNQAPNGVIGSPSANVTITQGGTVNFQGSGTDPDNNTPLTYLWNFGGSGIANSTAQNPGTLAFNTVGTFTVTLTVTDSKGLADPSPATVIVTVNAPVANQAPNGVIVAPALNVTVAKGGTVNFQGSGTDPDNNTPLTYLWNFGSSGIANSTAQNPGALTFNTLGTFAVTLTVTDSKGLADPTPATLTVTVTSTTGNQAPNGTILSPSAMTTITKGGTVSFQGAGTDPDNNLPLKYQWNFGAGSGISNSSQQNPGSKTFNNPGTFTVSLTVTDSKNLADPSPATVLVKVTSPCKDNDKDGYSPDGGACGPKDCNDSNASVTTCAPTNACINTLLANQIKITSAAWNGEDKLTVTGSNAPKGLSVQVSDAVTGTVLGTAKVEDSGQWKLEKEHLAASPCRVKADANGNSAQRAVTGAPASCSAFGEPPVCGSATTPSEEHDSEHDD